MMATKVWEQMGRTPPATAAVWAAAAAAERRRHEGEEELLDVPAAVERMYASMERDERRDAALPADLMDRPPMGLLACEEE